MLTSPAFSEPRIAEYTLGVCRYESNSMVSEELSSIPDTHLLLRVPPHHNDLNRYTDSSLSCPQHSMLCTSYLAFKF